MRLIMRRDQEQHQQTRITMKEAFYPLRVKTALYKEKRSYHLQVLVVNCSCTVHGVLCLHKQLSGYAGQEKLLGLISQGN